MSARTSRQMMPSLMAEKVGEEAEEVDEAGEKKKKKSKQSIKERKGLDSGDTSSRMNTRSSQKMMAENEIEADEKKKKESEQITEVGVDSNNTLSRTSTHSRSSQKMIAKKEGEEGETTEEEKEGKGEETEEEGQEGEEGEEKQKDGANVKKKKKNKKKIKEKKLAGLDSDDSFSSEHAEPIQEKLKGLFKKGVKENEDTFEFVGGKPKKAKKKGKKGKKKKKQLLKKYADKASSDSEDDKLGFCAKIKPKRPYVRALNPKTKGSIIAIVDRSLCKPDECKLECAHFCPVNRKAGPLEEEQMKGKVAIIIDKDENRAVIDEKLCKQVASCVKKCPFYAITINRMPRAMREEEISHSYGRNSFRLFKLVAAPSPGTITGIIGHTLVGKTMMLNMLSGKILPNFGDWTMEKPKMEDVTNQLKKCGLYGYIRKIKTEKPRILFKTQYINLVMRSYFGDKKVSDVVTSVASSTIRLEQIMDLLNLHKVSDKKIKYLSPGELQRVCLGVIFVQRSNYIILDEPTNFLDMKHKLLVAMTLKDRLERRPRSTIVVADNDLTFMEFVCSKTSFILGESGAYGVVSQAQGTRQALEAWSKGVAQGGIKFREAPFSALPGSSCPSKVDGGYNLHKMWIALPKFKMEVEGAHFRPGTITVVIGENGCGKTLLLDIITGKHRSAIKKGLKPKKINFSYKDQACNIEYKGPRTVRQLILKHIAVRSGNEDFREDVLSPLRIFDLYEKKMNTLTSAELQRLSLALCLGKEAELYLIDEPSSYLDADFRIIAAECIRDVVDKTKAPALIVDHDFRVAAFLADKVMLFDGEAGVHTVARLPKGAITTFAKYMKSMNFTASYDKRSGMMVINKPESSEDYKQKVDEVYYRARKFDLKKMVAAK